MQMVREYGDDPSQYIPTAPLALTAILAASTVALALLQTLSVTPDA
ncbi:hypothetical protein [Agrobacterium tumefaciens]